MTGWDEVGRRLRDALAGPAGGAADGLADGEFLVVGEPPAEPGPARGLLRRRAAPPPTRYVQFRRDRDHWYAECVGSRAFGGDWEVGPATHERLRGLGWLVPGEADPSGVQPSYPNYWRVLPRAEAARVAAMGVGALELLGTDPAGLEWRRGA